MLDLRQLREDAGVSRIVLADAAGVSRFKLYEYERGVRELAPEEQTVLARALFRLCAKPVQVAATLQPVVQGKING